MPKGESGKDSVRTPTVATTQNQALSRRSSRQHKMTEKICPECNGEGVVDQGTDDERRCPTCNGSGVVPDDGQGSEEVWNTHPER